ncbi:energy transducer TonB [Muriicola sp. Z0-33]|uniref:energy transducer TonB n=1 Tax=Muriicola sp. Z0-33 TaxID=2816957 RepID=UPI002238F597|nr:hypothetical protein [Muriicola sp. Z0-33]MCW5517483.1 hypothetical protein [Muriicola sp. Z0-33]
MKKRILVFSTVLAALGLTAFGFINTTNTVTVAEVITNKKAIAPGAAVEGPVVEKDRPDFRYDINTRYLMTVSKKKLQQAKSIKDILPYDWTDFVVSYKKVSVNIIENNERTEIRATGTSEVLTQDQLQLLQSADYSTNILIRADYMEKHEESGELTSNYFTPHMTVVPTQQAVYLDGKDALIKYLKENSREFTSNVEKGKLQPGRLNFTVSKNGTISAVELESTSGYPVIDKTMKALITNMPGEWEPAENAKGEKVAQKLVFFYGIIGC